MAAKITPSERQILDLLIYPETFDSILEESGLARGTVRADLMNLVSHGFIEVYEKSGKETVSPFYDSDHLEEFAFKATQTGLKAIQQ